MLFAELDAWWGLALDTVRLAVDAQDVIGLRLLRLAGGGSAAQSEASRMLIEKPLALAEAQMTLAAAMIGGAAHEGPRRVVKSYAKRVSANRRRLASR